MEGREREGPKLLLIQGPTEPCYATVIIIFIVTDVIIVVSIHAFDLTYIYCLRRELFSRFLLVHNE